jgi:two-component system OmpR family response regulator
VTCKIQNSAALAIAIFDGDFLMSQMLATFLQSEGCVVYLLDSAEVLDQTIRTEKVDVVLVNLVTPDASGLSVCKRYSGEGRPSIIVTSDVHDEVDHLLALRLGADGFIAKPYSPYGLLARLQAIARRQTLRRAGGTCSRPT